MTVSDPAAQFRKEPLESQDSSVGAQQEAIFARSILSRRILDAVSSPLLIINGNWQVIYANRAVLEMFNLRGGAGGSSGIREGEAFHCLHARSGSDGRQGESCRICGVARGVALALQGRETVSDCRLTCELAGQGAPLELRVWATPLETPEGHFSVLAITDIGQEKRRAFLASVCFHDLLNTLTGIRGLLDVLKYSNVDDMPEICEMLEQMTGGSIEEIMTLRLLEQAEDSKLTVHREEVRAGEFLEQTVKALGRHPAANGKHLALAPAGNPLLETDRTLLRRVLGNMSLNALEATEEGGRVTAGCRESDGEIEFWMHNTKPIPAEVRPRIFERSFSTKGSGRGLGTYSIQLLSGLLGGKAEFSSTPEDGTTFRVLFPKPKPEG